MENASISDLTNNGWLENWKNVNDTIDNLTNNEKNILYWASNGKTSEETSFILGLTKHTVQTYRKKAIQKLNASNISHSISIARSCNMIV